MGSTRAARGPVPRNRPRPSGSPRTSSRPLCRSTYPVGPDARKLGFVVDETAGLVPSPLPTPMLQPFEVYDQDLFDREMVRVFARSWVWLGDTEDLKEPGDFITGRIGYQGVVVIRQEDGEVRGFLNNC